MALGLIALGGGLLPPAAAATLVPPGNRHAEQPAIPGASVRRTKQTRSTFEAKYEKIRDLLAGDARLREKIRTVAQNYKIDPMHIVGALVGEHTYNVDAYDRLQSYYVKAVAYAGERFRFEYDGEKVTDFVQRPEFSVCDDSAGSRAVWSCREEVWNSTFRGKTVDGKSFPNNRFNAVFFEPFYAGQTFGLGQLSPLTALKNADRAVQISRIRPFSAERAAGVYEAIMDPDSTLALMAAGISADIEDYRRIADFDISANPGITATLYNVGEATRRARELAATNAKRAKRGQKAKLPVENYYGWLVNDKEAELRAIIGN
ncbi:DUF1402 family protein [Pseudohoeflea coraliihabitans]|uniref:DUF1402 family protein n=1 Tax=Pseudohoeflea coraliihabitans TaxID=2860393 RepID=UPI003D170D32